MVEHTLVEDGLVVMAAPDADAALKRAGEFTPSLVIVDQLAVNDPVALTQRLRLATGHPEMPVLILTPSGAARPALMIDDWFDFLERPFGSPMLRARVRAWVQRTTPERVGISAGSAPAIGNALRGEDDRSESPR
jgi:DNA-binding response OmpR family regulator